MTTDFETSAQALFSRIFNTFESLDSDVADIDETAGVINITFGKSRTKVVINTQRVAHQIWLAGRGQAWHFDLDGTDWRDTKARLLFDDIFQRLCAECGCPIELAAR